MTAQYLQVQYYNYSACSSRRNRLGYSMLADRLLGLYEGDPPRESSGLRVKLPFLLSSSRGLCVCGPARLVCERFKASLFAFCCPKLAELDPVSIIEGLLEPPV